MIFGALYFMAIFLFLGVGSYYIIEKEGLGNPHKIEMKGAVVVRWVVTVEASRGDAIRKPTIDRLVEVGGLDFDPPAAEC